MEGVDCIGGQRPRPTPQRTGAPSAVRRQESDPTNYRAQFRDIFVSVGLKIMIQVERRRRASAATEELRRKRARRKWKKRRKKEEKERGEWR